MIYKHRKLFPLETPTNQTQDCYGFCDPACPYNCYSNPDYFFSPPPPQLSEHSDQVNHISSYLIILVTLFTVIFLVVAFYVIKVKCYADWCGWRLNTSMVPQSNEDILNENQVDHPVWLIATVGLQQSIINSISVCKYKKDEGLVEGTECSVCLNEFHEDETLRLLPKCNHAFHVPCIDTWLRSHTTCPLCRAAIVSSTNVANGAPLPSTTLENSAANFERSQENLPEISRHDHDAVNVAVDAGESSEGLEFIDESNSKERVNDEVDIEMGSVSSNDPKLEVNCCSTESESNHWDGVDHIHVQSKTCKMRRSLIEECLHLSPVCMKRSFSCSGRTLSTRGYSSLRSKLHSSLLDFSIY